jgi:hypothetical protein
MRKVSSSLPIILKLKVARSSLLLLFERKRWAKIRFFAGYRMTSKVIFLMPISQTFSDILWTKPEAHSLNFIKFSNFLGRV